MAGQTAGLGGIPSESKKQIEETHKISKQSRYFLLAGILAALFGSFAVGYYFYFMEKLEKSNFMITGIPNLWIHVIVFITVLFLFTSIFREIGEGTEKENKEMPSK